MPATVTGIIGSDAVDLQIANAQMEQLLKDMLKEVKVISQNIASGGVGGGAGGGGGGAGGASGGPVGQASTVLASRFSALNLVTGAIQLTFNVLSNVVSGLAGIVGGVVGAFTVLAEKAMKGNARVSDFYDALGRVTDQIPLLNVVISPLIGLMQSLMKTQEANLDAYKKLTEVGVNFGGSLSTIRNSAAAAHLTLDEFTGLMTKNSKTFAMMGGNVNTGAEAFAKMSSALIKSDLGARLENLGYTSEQVNSGMASYIALSGGRNAQEMKNSKAIIESSAAYMEQLDGLAKITGESRQQQEEQLKEQSKNAAWQAKLQEMTPEQKDKAIAGMAQALATGGQGAVDAFQSQIMGVAPITKAAQNYTGMFSESAAGIRKSADMAMDSQYKIADMNKQMLDNQDTQAKEGEKYGSQLMFAIGKTNAALNDTQQAVTAANNRTRQQTREEREAALKKQDQQKSEAAAMIAGERALKNFGAALWSGLTPIISALTPLLTRFAEYVTDALIPVVKKFAPVLKDAMDKVIEWAKPVIDWFKGFFDDLSESDDIWETFKEGALEGLTNMWEAAKPYLLKAFDGLVEFLSPLFDKMIKALLEKLGITIESKEDKNKREGQDQTNWENMDIIEKALSGTSRTIEGMVGVLPGLGWLGDQMAARRVQRETMGNANTGRATGSLGMTGKLFENFGSGTTTELHGTEAVVTPDQMMQMLTNAAKTGQNNKLEEQLQRLNNVTSQMLAVMKESSEQIKRNVEATRSLRGNLFA